MLSLLGAQLRLWYLCPRVCACIYVSECEMDSTSAHMHTIYKKRFQIQIKRARDRLGPHYSSLGRGNTHVVRILMLVLCKYTHRHHMRRDAIYCAMNNYKRGEMLGTFLCGLHSHIIRLRRCVVFRAQMANRDEGERAHIDHKRFCILIAKHHTAHRTNAAVSRGAHVSGCSVPN